MAGTKKIFVSKNQYCRAHQPCKGIFEVCFYFHTVLSKLQMAPIIPISGINVPNLVQGFLRTCYLRIWPGQLEIWRSGLRYYLHFYQFATCTELRQKKDNEYGRKQLNDEMKNKTRDPILKLHR